jgi:amino acid adenylation domain-containing protein
MLQLSGCNELIVDRESADQIPQVLAGITTPMLIASPAVIDWRAAQEKYPQHRFISAEGFVKAAQRMPQTVKSDSIIYLLFTSGSTGDPKGVMVTQGNVDHYVHYISDRYSVKETDRFSQMFDTTFDLSAADLFVAWSNGACVCCPDAKMVLAPGRFIRDARLTIWFSVPSAAIFMKRFGMLKGRAYPGLRVSMFCGEALPAEIATAWQHSAPNSIVENLYGPTELTIACTIYRWDSGTSETSSALGTVPIGYPFPDMEALITDGELKEVNPGDDGELLMTGPQLSKGYLNDPERTTKAFVVPPGKSTLYYRTGDRVRQEPGKPIVYLGRMDNQVKILGHRVELGEVEAIARKVSGVDAVIAVPYPTTPSGAGGIELFLQAQAANTDVILRELSKYLAPYMVPRAIHMLPEFPRNANGKFDRKALLAWLNTR